eukprot:718567-Hanusia_phi.AAC.1
MPVGIIPQRGGVKTSSEREDPKSQNGFANSVMSSVGVYTRENRSTHSFRLKEPETPRTGRPSSRILRASTPKFNEKERSLIEHLDQQTYEELENLNSRLQEAKSRHLLEIKKASEEKIEMERELEKTLMQLSNAKQKGQDIMQSLKNDRRFLSTVMLKYKTLISKFEAQKMMADLTDTEEISSLRQTLADLRAQMSQAQNLAKILKNLEQTKVEASELANLLYFHKVDLALVQAGTRKAIAKAQLHKNSLFQALIELEKRMLSAKRDREKRLSDLVESRKLTKQLSIDLEAEEEEIIKKEISWLKEQLEDKEGSYASSPGTSTANIRSESGEVLPSSSGAENGSSHYKSQMKVLRLQIEGLEKEITAIGGDELSSKAQLSSAAGPGKLRPRPKTAHMKGGDRGQSNEERVARLQDHLLRIKTQIKKTESNLDREQQMREAEEYFRSQNSEMSSKLNLETLNDEKRKITEDIEWFEELLDKAGGSDDESSNRITKLQELLENDPSQRNVASARDNDNLGSCRQDLRSALTLTEGINNDLLEQVTTMQRDQIMQSVSDSESGEDMGSGEDVGDGVCLTTAGDDFDASTRSAGKAQSGLQLPSRPMSTLSHDVAGARGLSAKVELTAQEKALLREEILRVEMARIREEVKREEGKMREEIREQLRRRILAEEKEQQQKSSLKMSSKKQETSRDLQIKPTLTSLDPKHKKEVFLPSFPPLPLSILSFFSLHLSSPCFVASLSCSSTSSSQVEDYAAYLGIDPQQEPHYLWIAEMALMAPLPPGWTENKDSSGNVFFHNRSSSSSLLASSRCCKVNGLELVRASS